MNASKKLFFLFFYEQFSKINRRKIQKSGPANVNMHWQASGTAKFIRYKVIGGAGKKRHKSRQQESGGVGRQRHIVGVLD